MGLGFANSAMEGRLLIDHVNTLLSGGAAVSALRLHQGLLDANIGSRLWHARCETMVEAVSGTYPAPWPFPASSEGARFMRSAQCLTRRIFLRCTRSYFRRGKRKRSGGFLGFRQAVQTPFDSRVFEGDIVHFHWVGKLIDFPSFFKTMPLDRPLVWSLHDMHPMTGGCSHAFDCDGFTRSCGDCPILSRPGTRDLSFQELQIKRVALGDRPVFLIAPSHWMASMAMKSSLFDGRSVEVIRNPINTSVFHPENKLRARQELGLPETGFCLLFAAESLESKEKGINEYLAVLSRLSKFHPVFGLTFGRGEIVQAVDGVRIRNLGFLTAPSQLRLAYSAADVFVMPSHAETISQTAAEALACSTPVVAFEVGGVPELVRDGETGFLAKYLDVEQMAEKIRWLFDYPKERLAMADRGLALIRREFGGKHQIGKYIDFYRRVIEACSPVRSS